MNQSIDRDSHSLSRDTAESMFSPPSTNPASKAMGIRTNRETSLQLYFIWGMIDAAYIHWKGLEQHGYKFQIMPAARKKKKKKKSFALARRVKNL